MMGRSNQSRQKKRPGDRSGSQRPHKRSRNNKNKNKQQRQRGRSTNTTTEPRSFEPIQASKKSIHSGWMKQLGGLIRWYAAATNTANSRAMKQVEQMYIAGGCSVEATRDSILQALGATKDPSENWIDLSMIVESNNDNNTQQRIKLPTLQRPGEGPAHASQVWNTTLVPPSCVGKSYFCSVVNRSNIHLSCEMSIDGTKVAWNAPIPAQTTRSVKPETARYFGQHLWVLQPAKRITLHECTRSRLQQQQQRQRLRPPHSGPRYNGKRPNYTNSPDGSRQQRVSWSDFPDPCNYGWKFTGSVEESRVEFYEKKLNLGLVKMDFYYTTGTVKTVLDHPTTGMNQLFRKCQATPETFRQILVDPRAHTNIGYRRVDNAPTTAATQDNNENVDMMDQDEAATSDAVFFAKNDNYDFSKQGHANRQVAMEQLQPTSEFQAWEDAARTEWACIHAKFFISQPHQQRRRVLQKQKETMPEPLPSMKPIVDVKATEKASLSTEFHALGPAQAKRKSSVRMKRISLNDDSDWMSGPVFEYKLYYRADEGSAIVSEEDGSSSSANAEEDHEMDDDDDDDLPLAEKLAQQVPLETYKVEKLQQLEGWHRENKAFDADEAETMRRSASQQMQAAPDTGTVDQVLKSYWDWHQKQQWATVESS